MSIRQIEWTNKNGKVSKRWMVAYTDLGGRRRHRNFTHKRDAVDYAATVYDQKKKGIHVADNASVTVKEAGAKWIQTGQSNRLERSTIDQYRQHLDKHLVPFIGQVKLSRLTVPFIREFEDRLRVEGRSPKMVKGVIGSLGAILSDAQEHGMIAHNPVRELKGRRKKGTRQDRHIRKLRVGVDIPTPDEIRKLLAAAKGRWRPFLLMAVFTGLRASEMRGLRWDDVDLSKGELHVRQRADRYNVIGSPKSAAGERTVPLPPTLVAELRQWKLCCPKAGKLGLVYPNGAGNIENHVNIRQRGLIPTMIAAGIVLPKLDKHGVPMRDNDGKPIVEPKYTGLHALRHFYASWCINRKEDNGLGLPAKVVQERLGHSTITMTLDTYGHLFPRGDDQAELAQGERWLLA